MLILSGILTLIYFAFVPIQQAGTGSAIYVWSYSSSYIYFYYKIRN